MSERHLSEYEKRFVLPPECRLTLLEDLYPGRDWTAYPDEEWHGYAALTDLELLNIAIVRGGRVGTLGETYGALAERFNRDRLPAFEGKCSICWQEAIDVQIDHIWPVSRYPELVVSMENLAPACRECNMAKSSRDPSDAEIAYIESVTGVAIASPIDWQYRPDPPIESTFVQGFER